MEHPGSSNRGDPGDLGTWRDLRVLLCSPSDEEAQPILGALRLEGFACTVTRVDAPQAMRDSLGHAWDVVICDHAIPGFDARSALALLAERALDLPFIVVARTHEPEEIVAAMRAGAHDFLPTRALPRLPAVVAREVREAAQRRAHKLDERSRVEAERAAWLETLAAQIGHALNNPLAVMTLNLELLAEELARLDGREALAGVGGTVAGARAGASAMQIAIRRLMAAFDTKAPAFAVPRGHVEVRLGVSGRVLIVDDEVALAAALQRVLAKEHEVVVVTHGRDAIAVVERGERFDVILCDLMMPEVSGVDVHRELTRLAPDQAAKMVFMTGGAPSAVVEHFLKAVTNPCLDKPLDLHGLRSIVRSLLATFAPPGA